MPEHTTLTGVPYVGMPLITDQLEHNLAQFFDWGSLNAYGFFDVPVGASGAYGGNASRLRKVNDPSYTDYTVYEAHRYNWVWESGVQTTPAPIGVTGVYINGSLQPASSYDIDYKKGRIIFDTPVSGTVTASYSYKWIHWLPKSTTPEFRYLFSNSFRLDDSTFLQEGSGLYDILAQNRIQLPAVFIEQARRRNNAYQLGGGQVVKQEILFHIVSEDGYMADQISDIICNQSDKTLHLFDRSTLMASGLSPLNADGGILDATLTYPTLVRDYFWRYCRIVKAEEESNQQINGLFRKVVRMNTEIVMDNLT